VTSDAERREANKQVFIHQVTHMRELIDAGLEEVKTRRTKETDTFLPFGGMDEPMRTDDYGWAGMNSVPNTFKFWRHEIINIFDCLDPDVFWVEADAVARTRTLDLDYHQRYVMRVTFKDGKFADNTEYFDGDQVQLLMRELQHQQRWADGQPDD
jgi:ketosteroid isomerase-like protein